MLRSRFISFMGIIILFFVNSFEIKASERLFSIAKDTFKNVLSSPSLNATSLKSDSKDTTEFIEKWVPKEDSREAVVKPAYNYSESDSSIYESAEINPEPPGGMIAFRKWISENYQYPQEAIDARVEGTIEVFFVVEKDGSFTNIKVLSDLSHGTGQAAINLMKRAKKWSPGINNGRPVRAVYKIPFRIDLTNM